MLTVSAQKLPDSTVVRPAAHMCPCRPEPGDVAKYMPEVEAQRLPESPSGTTPEFEARRLPESPPGTTP
jgi:hypothetical protein